MRRTNYFVWLIILLGVLFIWNAAQHDSTVPTSYSAFEQQLDSVSKFELLHDTRSFLYTVEDKPTVFTSTFPTPDHAARAVDTLMENGVSIYADPPKKASFLATFFFSFFPILSISKIGQLPNVKIGVIFRNIFFGQVRS